MWNNSIFTVPLVQYLQTLVRNHFNESEQIFEILQLLRIYVYTITLIKIDFFMTDVSKSPVF